MWYRPFFTWLGVSNLSPIQTTITKRIWTLIQTQTIIRIWIELSTFKCLRPFLIHLKLLRLLPYASIHFPLRYLVCGATCLPWSYLNTKASFLCSALSLFALMPLVSIHSCAWIGLCIRSTCYNVFITHVKLGSTPCKKGCSNNGTDLRHDARCYAQRHNALCTDDESCDLLHQERMGHGMVPL